MPPKRPSLLEEPPTASSSSDEEEEEEEEVEEGQDPEEEEEEDDDDDNDDEGEEEDEQVKKPPVKAVHPPTPSSGSGPDAQSSESEDDEDSGTESGSDSESPEEPTRPSRIVDPNIKAISSKPMDNGLKSKNPATKPSAAPSPATPPGKFTVAAKRPAESDKDGRKDSKRGKRKHSDEEEDAGVSDDAEKKPGEDRKKQMFQRVWTEDDELAILKGMLDYYSKKGTVPSADMNVFHEYIKKSFHVEFSRNQLADKIRRLRKKYQNNVGRGKNPIFSKPHEQKAFELSKKIWGDSAANDIVSDQTVCNGNLGNTSRKPKKVVGSLLSKAILLGLAEEEIDWSLYPHLAESFQTKKEAWMMYMPNLEDSFVEQGACLLGSAKLKELEHNWRNLRMAELDLLCKRMELMREQVKLFQDACNSRK
ncbi:STOREKEEPER protein-like [Macadamia integrifolia]|uniref:STOREKEEPER protein-like n=1 Tax=Macadamia integrifolia TaxID=60698 RepID=UPI001C4FB046|nr:STOREKEEPER protein-like [Macadamia integrifolia]